MTASGTKRNCPGAHGISAAGVDHRCGVAWHPIRLRTLASSGRSLWRFYRHRLGLRINSQPLPQLRPPSPLPRTLDRDRQRFPLSTRSSVSTPATAAATPKSLSSGPSITTPASTRLAVSLSKTSNSSIRWRMTNGRLHGLVVHDRRRALHPRRTNVLPQTLVNNMTKPRYGLTAGGNRIRTFRPFWDWCLTCSGSG
jgi:hypothetical protein